MAKAKAKRRRKHRGTQAGTIARADRSSRGRGSAAGGSGGSKASDKGARREQARRRREERLDRPPTWRSAFNRAAIAAVIVGILAVAALGNTPFQAIVLAAIMLLVYVPLGYAFDTFVYRLRQRRKQAGAGGASGGGGSGDVGERRRSSKEEPRTRDRSGQRGR